METQPVSQVDMIENSINTETAEAEEMIFIPIQKVENSQATETLQGFEEQLRRMDKSM